MVATCTRTLSTALVHLFLASLLSCSAQHYDVPLGEWMAATSRLIIADNDPGNTNVAVVELPSFTLSHRVSVPGITQQLGLTADHRSMAVFRARGGNDQHFITFMSTGLIGMSGVVTTNLTTPPEMMPGFMRRVVATRSILAVNGTDASMGAENGVDLLYHPMWKTHLLYAENHGLVAAYNATAAAMSGDFSITKAMYVPIGHYHVVIVDNYIFAAHTGTSEAIMLDQDGHVVHRFHCASCHGSEKYEADEYTIALFGCGSSVLAVTVPHTRSAMVNISVTVEHMNVSNPRIGSFVEGAPGVFWTPAQSGAYASTPCFYRTDVREASSVSVVNHSGTTMGSDGYVIRAQGLPSKQRMLAIHRSGIMVMYDGITGEAVSNISLIEGGFPVTSTAPFITPFLSNSTVFITVPATGTVHEVGVDFSTGVMSMGRVLTLGGQPQMAVVAEQDHGEHYHEEEEHDHDDDMEDDHDHEDDMEDDHDHEDDMEDDHDHEDDHEGHGHD